MSPSAGDSRCPVCDAALGGQTWCALCSLSAVLDDGAPEAHSDGLFQVAGHLVLEELGRGATGIVYRARQENPARDVALKILRPHEAGSAESRARFGLEASTVAALDHPAILPVLNVGEHDGLPYFTMKLCRGGSLADRRARYGGKWREIAGLVAKLADAIHRAHQRGVLHRDLKPGNILFDEAERPYVSDFGIAKRLTESEPGAPLTRPLAVFGTPGYLAPEVRQHGTAGATLAADIYGLGAILEELITGTPPSNAPGPTPHGALKACPRDLAVITAKCLADEPTQRYTSAVALADDLRAWLAGRPIAARPLSAFGQACAWARRNPALAGVSATAAIALLAVAVVATISAVRLGREQRATIAALAQVETERKNAVTEADTSKAIAAFLQNDLLGQASPDRQADRDLKLRQVLDRAAKTVGTRFGSRPLVEAALRETLGTTYGALGDYAAMQLHLQRALELRTPQEGTEPNKVHTIKRGLAEALLKQGKLREAEPFGRAAFSGMSATLGPEHATTIDCISILSEICEGLGQTEEALRLTEQMLDRSKRALGPEHYSTLTAMNDRAALLGRRGHPQEAEKLFRETFELRKKTLGAEHPATLVTMSNLAGAVLHQNKPAEAEGIYAELAAIETRVLGAEHPYTLTARGGLALAYQANGKFEEAVAQQRQVFASRTRIFGAANVSTLNSVTNLASALLDAGLYDEAESLYLRLLQAREKSAGADAPQTLSAKANLAFAHRLQGKLQSAQTLEEETFAARERVLGPEHRETLNSMGSLAIVLQQRGRTPEAEALLTRRLEISRRIFGNKSADTLRALDRLGGLLVGQGRFQEAEPLLRESLQSRLETDPSGRAAANTRSLLGAVLAGLARFAEAEPLLREGYLALAAVGARIPAHSRNEVRDAGTRLIELYVTRGMPAEAEQWRHRIAETAKATPP